MTDAQAARAIKEIVIREGGYRKSGKKRGIDSSHLCSVCTGRRPAGDKVLTAYGFGRDGDITSVKNTRGG